MAMLSSSSSSLSPYPSSSRVRRFVLAFCTASLGGMLLQLTHMASPSIGVTQHVTQHQALQVALSTTTTTTVASNNNTNNNNKKTTIAYTVALTDCPAEETQRFRIYDAAAVLQHSIHKASVESSSSHFDYQMIAIVHTNATDCAALLRDKLGFQILVRDTPIDVNKIVNRKYAADLVRSGCCAERELLKLYAYTLHDYPVVVQVDLDFFLVKPLDDLFHAFLSPSTTMSDATFWQQHAMYPPHTSATANNNLQAMFTRQYGLHSPDKMADPRVDYYYMQGGLLLVRPNATAFDELLQIVLQGNFERGWYDNRTRPHRTQYPKSFGGETVQGLIPFYYGQYASPGAALELHWCRHNTLVAANTNSRGQCLYSFNQTTMKNNSGECIPNCRLAAYEDIYSAHFTDDCVKLVSAFIGAHTGKFCACVCVFVCVLLSLHFCS